MVGPPTVKTSRRTVLQQKNYCTSTSNTTKIIVLLYIRVLNTTTCKSDELYTTYA